MNSACEPLRVQPRTWLADPMPTDVVKTIERLQRFDDVHAIAIMPDVHLCHTVSVGTVFATRHCILPQAVGGDIGCGMLAIAFEEEASFLQGEKNAACLFDALYERVPSNRHRQRHASASKTLDGLFEQLSSPHLNQMLHREGVVQLGTLGRGNHFLEFQRDARGQLWLMIHSGSRAMGQAVSSFHLQRADRTPSAVGGLAFFEVASPEGEAFLRDMQFAREYAAANRLAMATAVMDFLEEKFRIAAVPESLIHSDHNHVQRETHAGEDAWVHRKGAQSARDGEWGVVPGSMGSASFHITGRGVPDALFSCSHGAGRKWHRQEARRRVSSADLVRQLQGVWFDIRNRHQLRDEAPTAYRNIHKVMKAQGDLVKIERELYPLLNYKGV